MTTRNTTHDVKVVQAVNVARRWAVYCETCNDYITWYSPNKAEQEQHAEDHRREA